MKSLPNRVAVLCLLLTLSLPAFAQWNLEWTSGNIPSGVISGWLAFQQSGGNWQYRFYTLDTLAFRVMDSPESQSVQYSYTFSSAERLAGEMIYSLGIDLNGNGIVEFYVMAAVGTSSPYRETIKVFDITNGQTVFQRDLSNYSYSAATVWDVDNDGILECVFTRADYPSAANTSYEVYSTGVSNGLANHPQTPRLLNLRQNYPNPFNPSTRIDYELSSPGRVELDIVNVLGQRVGTIVDETQAAGAHSAVWDGTDGNGNKQASGPYYYQIRVNGQSQQTRQMLLLK